MSYGCRAGRRKRGVRQLLTRTSEKSAIIRAKPLDTSWADAVFYFYRIRTGSLVASAAGAAALCAVG